jgi:purine nucleoside permease
LPRLARRWLTCLDWKTFENLTATQAKPDRLTDDIHAAKVCGVGVWVGRGVLRRGSSPSYAAASGSSPRPVKALIISMFGPKGQPWIDKLGLTQSLDVPGLSEDYRRYAHRQYRRAGTLARLPKVFCNSDDVCLITTGMGHANVAASLSVLVYKWQARP